MSAPDMHEMTNCPTDETLAAFVDRKLNGAEREAVIAHLADCADCRDIVVMATEEVSAANVVRPAFGFRKLAPLIAVAAALAVVFGIPSVRERILPNPMGEIVEMAREAPRRPGKARLSLDVPYKDATPVYRGGKEEIPKQAMASDRAPLVAAKANVRAAENATVRNLHAAGVASMFAADYGAAVQALEQAEKESKPPSAALLNDLAAAYLASGEYERALERSSSAWEIERSRAAAWNRALALTRLRRAKDAGLAWKEYLKIDPDSPWAQEARNEHLPDSQLP